MRLLEEATTALTTTPKDIELAVRKYAAACELLGWRGEADAAWLELSGCTADNVSSHRLVWAIEQWVPSRSLGAYQRVHVVSSMSVRGKGELADRSIEWQTFVPVSELIRHASDGVYSSTAEPHREFRDSRGTYECEQQLWIPPQAVQAVLDRIERWVFRAAVTARTTLHYAEDVENAWDALRVSLDEPLTRLALGSYLEQIQAGVRARNPFE